MKNNSRLVLMNRERIKRSLNRIAHQIREDNPQDKELVLFGINERGYVVAKMLQEVLAMLTDSEVSCNQLLLENKQDINWGSSPEEAYVLLVDDVIFSGKTMFRALKHLSDQELPGEVHAVVLVDRGHRKFPISAKYVGMDLPTKLDEHVSVEIQENHPSQVLLYQSMY